MLHRTIITIHLTHEVQFLFFFFLFFNEENYEQLRDLVIHFFTIAHDNKEEKSVSCLNVTEQTNLKPVKSRTLLTLSIEIGKKNTQSIGNKRKQNSRRLEIRDSESSALSSGSVLDSC